MHKYVCTHTYFTTWLPAYRYKGQKTPLNFVHINLSVVLLVALVLFVGTSYTLRHYPVRHTP